MSIGDIMRNYENLSDKERKMGGPIEINEYEEDKNMLHSSVDSKLYAWDSYITISRGKWIGRYFQRNEVEIKPIRISEFEVMFQATPYELIKIVRTRTPELKGELNKAF